jgi:two-component system response regulator AtoC
MSTDMRSSAAEPISQIPPDEVLFGRSIAMGELRQRAEKIANTNIAVLLTGDGGTGKEALARWIHSRSSYRNGQFVKVNCAAIPGTLLESEIFGYEKGAFTDAHASKPGRVELAHNGTLFLDEIADLDLSLQSKILHFLQDGIFTRIGDSGERTVDARVICATNKDLEQEMDAGRFRADLFYRINVVRLRLPRLRERREDIPVLAEYFRALYERQFGKESDQLSAEMFDYLQNLSWPGNVRELSNGIARYVLIGPEAVIPEEQPQKRTSVIFGTSLDGGPASLKSLAKEAIREMERNVILETLRANHWNRRKTAQALKISYRALIYKIRDAGLISGRSRVASASRS